MKPFYTHQQIELPEIGLDVIHYVPHQGICSDCGKAVSAELLKEQSFGYGQNQQCLAHFIRKARALSESGNQQMGDFGAQMLVLLQQLCHFAKAPPGKRKWTNFIPDSYSC